MRGLYYYKKIKEWEKELKEERKKTGLLGKWKKKLKEKTKKIIRALYVRCIMESNLGLIRMLVYRRWFKKALRFEYDQPRLRM